MARETKRLKIGDLARRTGVAVKTLRLYSDEGILPPAGRTAAGYRTYDEAAIARVELVRTLREAGIGIEGIREVVSHELSLAEALRIQLAAVEAHIVSLEHVASALRAALRSEPTEQDVRRIAAVTKLSNEERRKVIEGFYEEVSRGTHMDPTFRKQVIETAVPVLPEVPTRAQLDAWIEMAEILRDPGFLEATRASIEETWTEGFDHVAYREAAQRMVDERRGVDPTSAEAKAIVERAIAGFARASGKEPTEEFRRDLRRKYEGMDPRATRYWELVAILKGDPPRAESPEWAWFRQASRHHFP